MLWICLAPFALGPACGSDDASDATANGDATTSPSGVSFGDVTVVLQPPQPNECVSDGDCASALIPACHQPRCDLGACRVVASPDDTFCDDSDACTRLSRCEGGVCLAGLPLSCDDGNACTASVCDPALGCRNEPAVGVGCDDGDPCTTDDVCRDAGECAGLPDTDCTCASDVDCQTLDDSNRCNGELRCEGGFCRLDQRSRIVCPSAGACRVNICVPATGSCELAFAPDGAGCDDGNPCTTEDACLAGRCSGVPGVCSCSDGDDCKALQPPSYDLCQGPLVCLAGVCAPDAEVAIDCEHPADAPSCTATACDAHTGLCVTSAAAQGSPCAANAACTATGSCHLGVCEPGPPECDDANPCTADVCTDQGCAHTPIAGSCDDGDPCTSGDSCQTGLCVGGPPPTCDDGNPCTDDRCDDAAGGCFSEPRPAGLPCDDGDACTTLGLCDAGACVGVTAVACDDGNPCTLSACTPGSGCTHKPRPDGDACPAPDACTQPGSCAQGLCVALPVPCGDGSPCTLDGCDPAAGCTHVGTNHGAPCDPMDPCLIDGTCFAGECEGGVARICDDGLCDVRECDPSAGGCVSIAPLADGTPCGGDACLSAGSCEGGACVGVATLPCDDDDPCTVDTCDPIAGCSHVPLVCPDAPDSACTEGRCVEGTCELAPSPLCVGLQILYEASFPCGEPLPVAWTLDPADGGLLGPAPDGHCALGLGPEPAVARLSGIIAGPEASSLVVRYRHLPPAGDYSIAIGSVGAEPNAPSDHPGSQPPTALWVIDSDTFDVVLGELLLVLSYDGHESAPWWIDRLVVGYPEAPELVP